MRKKIRLAVLAVPAALLISGCGENNYPSGTEREKNITTAGSSAPPESVTTAASATAAPVTTADTAATTAQPEISDLDFLQYLYEAEEVMPFSKSVKDIDGIRAFDHSSDDMDAVIGYLLAGEIGSQLCENDDLIADNIGILSVGCDYYKVIDASGDECTFLWFTDTFTDQEPEAADPYHREVFDVFGRKAFKENGEWRLDSFSRDHAGYCDTVTCRTAELYTNRAHRSREAEQKLEEDYTRIIRDYMLGVWHGRESGKDVVVGINEKYDPEPWFGSGSMPVKISITDEEAVMYVTNYIGDLFIARITADKPDELIYTDCYADYIEETGDWRSHGEIFDRTDTAEMYPDTGAITLYNGNRLHCRNYYYEAVSIPCEGYTYTNDFYTSAAGKDDEFMLVEDDGDRIVLSSLFRVTDDMNAPATKRFKFEMKRTEKGRWTLGEYEDMSDDTLAYVSKEYYDYSDRHTLHIPANCTDEDVGALINELMDTTIGLDPENTFFALKDGCLFSRDMTVLYAVPYDAKDQRDAPEIPVTPVYPKIYTVPESVTYIAPHAFYKSGYGRHVDWIIAGENITDENIAELDLYAATEVWSNGSDMFVPDSVPRRAARLRQ